MKALSYIIISTTLLTSHVFAGGSLGGGGASLQLQEMAMSEKIISTIDMSESVDDNVVSVEIELKASVFSDIATDALNGNDFIYRNVPVRVTELDEETLTMIPIDDSSLTLIVKAESSK
jgi:hypothetical protein